MNLNTPIITASPNAEVQKLFHVLSDCGVSNLWSKPELRILRVYLENCDADENIHKCLGQGLFWHIVKQVKPKTRQRLTCSNIVEDTLFWILRYANGHDLKQALRQSVMQSETNAALQVNFDRTHPSFTRDYNEFDKFVTLMVIEGFPADLGLVRDLAVQRLNCYELLLHRHGNAEILQQMKASITKSESKVFNSEMLYHRGKRGVKLRGKTTSSKKFLALSYIDRIRLMRYYRFRCPIK